MNMQVHVTNDNCGSDRLHKGLRIVHPDGREAEAIYPQKQAVRILASNDVALEALTDLQEFNRLRELPQPEKDAAHDAMAAIWDKWFEKKD